MEMIQEDVDENETIEEWSVCMSSIEKSSFIWEGS